MSGNGFDAMLLQSAEQTDRKLGPMRIAQIKQSYAFFAECGLSDEEIKSAMALTAHEMQLIRRG